MGPFQWMRFTSPSEKSQSLPVPVKSIQSTSVQLINPGPNEVVAKKLQQWEAKYEHQNLRSQTSLEKREAKEQALKVQAKTNSKKRYLVRAFIVLCKDFFHAPIGDLKKMDREALRVLEGQLVKRARLWELINTLTLIPPLALIGGLPASILMLSGSNMVAGVFVCVFTGLLSIITVPTFFSISREFEDACASHKYLACRRFCKRIYGESNMIENLYQSLRNKK